MKKCTKCGETKPLDEFHRDAGRADGRFPHCKECRKRYTQTYRDRQRSKDRERRATAAPHECVIDGCAKETIDRMCRMHAARVARHGSPHAVHAPTYLRGPDHPAWTPDEVLNYSSAHRRIRKVRGSAKSHRCINCNGRADEWAYRGGSPLERSEMRGSSVLAFSPDVHAYEAMCVPCHRAFDAWVRDRGRFDDLTEDELEAAIDEEIDRWTQPKESK